MNSIPSPNNREEDNLLLAIKEEQLSVAPENSVKIHVALINKGPIEDYVDILVKGVPSEWTTIDTPVVHIAPGEAKQIVLTIQPPPVPQSRVGQYPLDVSAVSQSDPRRSAMARSILTVAAYQSRGRIGVMLGSVHFSISPGSSVSLPILVQNRGLEEDSYHLNIEGIPANWISTNAALTKLEPSTSKEVQLTIRVPRSSEAAAGRTPFKIQVGSLGFPDQKTEVDCILTITAFSKFSAALQPDDLRAAQPGRLLIDNEGNIIDVYTLNFESPGGVLIFEKGMLVKGNETGSQPKIAYVEIPVGERVQVPAGERGIYAFRSRLRSRPLVGNVKTYPFTVKVLSSENKAVETTGGVSETGLVPPWVLSASLIGLLLLCLIIIFPVRGMQAAARLTQTAAINQTQLALSGQTDADADGLLNSEEVALGTDPTKPDTDGDGLSDKDEVNTHKTNPVVADTDADGLVDGQEIQNYKTDALKPDTDSDLLNDGPEIERRTDPLNADTDLDGLGDGAEVNLGTDPLQQDTDRDGLIDSKENQTCPRPLTPDSDTDGITDGNDLDPCNPANPLLTATALARAPTATQIPPTVPQPTLAPPTAVPTSIPTLTPLPTSTTAPLPTNTTIVLPTNTSPPNATATPALPTTLQGILLFESNRDGNSEIYAVNLVNQSMLRLTNNAAVDTQPSLAPDSVRVAYVSNQNGNNEIYLTGLDRRAPVNLTNSPADDQYPTWSPDGNWIAFTSNRDGNQEIYVMRSDGSQVRNLTANVANDFAPTWFMIRRFLGNEDWIAFTSTRDGNLEIYKVKPDGTGLANLTNNPANDYSPSGYIGGSVLAFVTDRDGNPEIYTMNDRGGTPTNTTNNFAQELDPAISSDGQWIAFSSDRDGNLEIYAFSEIDGKTYNLSRNSNQERYPDW